MGANFTGALPAVLGTSSSGAAEQWVLVLLSVFAVMWIARTIVGRGQPLLLQRRVQACYRAVCAIPTVRWLATRAAQMFPRTRPQIVPGPRVRRESDTTSSIQSTHQDSGFVAAGRDTALERPGPAAGRSRVRAESWSSASDWSSSARTQTQRELHELHPSEQADHWWSWIGANEQHAQQDPETPLAGTELGPVTDQSVSTAHDNREESYAIPTTSPAVAATPGEQVSDPMEQDGGDPAGLILLPSTPDAAVPSGRDRLHSLAVSDPSPSAMASELKTAGIVGASNGWTSDSVSLAGGPPSLPRPQLLGFVVKPPAVERRLVERRLGRQVSDAVRAGSTPAKALASVVSTQSPKPPAMDDQADPAATPEHIHQAAATATAIQPSSPPPHQDTNSTLATIATQWKLQDGDSFSRSIVTGVIKHPSVRTMTTSASSPEVALTDTSTGSSSSLVTATHGHAIAAVPSALSDSVAGLHAPPLASLSLTPQLVDNLQPALPRLLQARPVWGLLYHSAVHGAGVERLLERAGDRGPVLLVVRLLLPLTTQPSAATASATATPMIVVVGALLPNLKFAQPTKPVSGNSFVFSSSLGHMGDDTVTKVWKWRPSHAPNRTILVCPRPCGPLVIGAGGDGAALLLDSRLEHVTSAGTCDTFGTEASLTGHDGAAVAIGHVEVWTMLWESASE